MSQELRQQIVDEAKKYIGVKFLHQGRSIHGVDCIGLIIAVGKSLGYEVADYRAYSRTPDSKTFKNKLAHYLEEIDVADAQKGDIIFLRYGGLLPRHVAIISEDQKDISKNIEPKIIHAINTPSLNRVVEENLETYRNGITAAFRFRGK